MKIFYEERDPYELPHLARNCNHVFPAHFHQEPEILLVRKGGYTVTVNEKIYEVTEGCIAVFDTFDIHIYHEALPSGETDDAVVILPYRYTAKFNAARKNMKIATPVIRDEPLCNELLRLADTFFRPEQPESVQESAAELFLSLLETRLDFVERSASDESALIRKILSYVQANYRGDISLESTADHLGYTTAHVSRAFHKYIKIGLPEYVNDLRLSYIERIRQRGDKRKMVDLIFEAGFKSQQTYYRHKSKRAAKYCEPDKNSP